MILSEKSATFGIMLLVAHIANVRREGRRRVMLHAARLVFAVAAVGWLAATPVSAADKLKIAVGQGEIWHGAPAALGERAGIFRKHDLDLDLLFTSGSGETMQATIAGSVDIGVAAGTFGVMGAYAKGAPIRIIGAESTGEDAYWYVRAESPVKSMADMKGRTMAYSTNGSSTHANALAFLELYKVDAKLVTTGGFPPTFTMVMSGQIDAGWSAPPYAMEALRKGEIRVIARSAELPLVKGHTVRVLIANKADLDGRPDVYRRFMRAYRETVDWMYASDEAPKIYAEFAKISIEDARRVREEFDPKEMLIPDRVLGLNDLVPDAVKFKYLSQPLTASQLDDLVQIPK
jgi:NitT/TauT family transport system substrate-binding protein